MAVGNTALFTRDEVPATGLLGMDLVRLALERARDATTAKDVITSLLDEHGQGGSAAVDWDRRYHNSFMVVDRGGAWVLETSARHWVAKRMRRVSAISNLATVGDDWDECSDGIDAYARDRGWWTAPAGTKLDFRAAFEDPARRSGAEGGLRAELPVPGSGHLGRCGRGEASPAGSYRDRVRSPSQWGRATVGVHSSRRASVGDGGKHGCGVARAGR